MSISEKSIIPPEPPKPGIPIKKSTLALLLLVLLLATFAGSLVISSGSTQTQQQPTAEKPAVGVGADTGTAAAIEEEQKKEKDKAELAARQSSAGSGKGAASGQSGSASPIPAGLKRDNQDSALYEKAFAGAAGPGGKPVNGSPAADEARNRAIEMEALSRGSKVMSFDDGGDSPAKSGGSNAVTKGFDLSSMLPAAAVLGQAPQKVPSESMPSGVEAAVAALRGGNAASTKGADQSRAWLKEYASEQKRNEVITSYPTASKFTLHQGKVIPAVLARKVNSDLPGEISAFTTMDVYDSLGHGYLLIPKGSALVGRYDSGLKLGQERLMFAFQRIILPNGQSFDLPAANGSDLAGAAGMTGDVNNHFFKMFASSFLVAWGAQQVTPTTTTASGTTQVSPAGQVLVDVSKTILERNRSIPPTITIDQGIRINVEVAKDMEFTGPYLRSKN